MFERAKMIINKVIDTLNNAITPLSDNDHKYDALLESIGDARVVLMGEATHGTEEFYQARIEITEQLIRKKNFVAIAVEGDWPSVYQLHRYIQSPKNQSSMTVLNAFNEFTRFPAWMWRNQTMPPFLNWLHEYNQTLKTPAKKIGIYGLDLYSLQASIQAVIDYLAKTDPAAEKQARERYACFDHMPLDPQMYGYLVSTGEKKACVEETVRQLLELQHNAYNYLKNDGLEAEEELFYTIQNARVIKNAETYYRSLFETRALSWNVRDKHMMETLANIANHLEKRHGVPAKIIIWAHNSHVGDARATEMSERREINLGQLVREEYGNEAYLLGFSTYEGTVTAASDWDAPSQTKILNPGLAGSYEDLFHHLMSKNFLLDLHNKSLEHYLYIPRLQRAVGVIYRPELERTSHYYFTRLLYQFDCIIHFDQTTAVKPITT